MPKRSASSTRWLQRQHKDLYTQKAKSSAFASRASFKLTQMNEQYRLFHKAHLIIELGASPGGWSQVITASLQPHGGQLLAVDMRPMKHQAANMTFLKNDLTQANSHEAILQWLAGRKADGILSDLAPNISGIKDKDHATQMHLCQCALALAKKSLAQGGFLLTKVTQGNDLNPWRAELQECFANHRLLKPAASRQESREQYLLARAFTAFKKHGTLTP